MIGSYSSGDETQKQANPVRTVTCQCHILRTLRTLALFFDEDINVQGDEDILESHSFVPGCMTVLTACFVTSFVSSRRRSETCQWSKHRCPTLCFPLGRKDLKNHNSRLHQLLPSISFQFRDPAAKDALSSNQWKIDLLHHRPE